MTLELTEAQMEAAAEVWTANYFATERKDKVALAGGDEAAAFQKFAASMDSMMTKFLINALKKNFAAASTQASVPTVLPQPADPLTVAPVVVAPVIAARISAAATVSSSMQVDEPSVPAQELPAERAAVLTEDPAMHVDAAAAKVAEPKKATGNDKKKQKKDVTEPAAVEFTVDGLFKASQITANAKPLSIEILAKYARDPDRARFLVSAIVASVICTEKAGEKALGVLCKDAVQELEADVTGFEEDLSTDAKRVELFKKIQAAADLQLSASADAEKYSEKAAGGKAKAKALREHDSMKAMRAEALVSIKLEKIVPFKFQRGEAAQICVIVSNTADAQNFGVAPLRPKNSSYFFSRNQLRAFVSCLFSDAALVDAASLGSVVVADAKLEVADLVAAYKTGDGAAVFQWFGKTFPALTDNLNPNRIDAENFLLVEQPEIAAKISASAAPKKAKKKGADNEEAQLGVENAKTIEQFAAVKRQTLDSASVAAAKKKVLASVLTFAVASDPTSVGKCVRAYVEQTGIEAERKKKVPAATVDDVRSIVMPANEAKATATSFKKAKEDKDDETDDAAANDEEVCVDSLPTSSREVFLAYSAKIPKVSRHLLMGNELTAAEKITSALKGQPPSTKPAVDVHLNDIYATANDYGRALPDGVVLDDASLLKLVDGLKNNRPEARVDLIMAMPRLRQSMSHIAIAADRAKGYTLAGNAASEHFGSEPVTDFLARSLCLTVLLSLLKDAAKNEAKKEKNFAIVEATASKIGDLASGWL